MNEQEKAFWLIERDYNGETQYLSTIGTYSESHPTGQFCWGRSIYSAIWFVRKQDAVMCAAAIVNMQDRLQHCHTLAGIRDGDPFPRIVEHKMVDRG